jgi:hypothetical protein
MASSHPDATASPTPLLPPVDMQEITPADRSNVERSDETKPAFELVPWWPRPITTVEECYEALGIDAITGREITEDVRTLARPLTVDFDRPYGMGLGAPTDVCEQQGVR